MLSGISPLSLIIILLLVVLLFGTKKLRNVGSDLGSAIRNFKKGLKDNEQEEASPDEKNVIEGESSDTKDDR